MTDPGSTPERPALRKSAAGFVTRSIPPHLVECVREAEYLGTYEVERHYRDVRIPGIGGGATEILADLAGRLLGYAAAAPARPASSARPAAPAPSDRSAR